MQRHLLTVLGGVLLIAGCNSPVDSGANQSVSNEAEKAGTSFKEAIAHAFSKEAEAELASIGNGPARNFGATSALIVCDMYDKKGGALFLAGMDQEEANTCAIWGMAARSLNVEERNAVVGANVEGDISVNSVWEGKASVKGRVLPAVLVEAHFNIVNKTEGVRSALCVRKFSVIDGEFEVERDIMYRSCAPQDAGTIGEAMEAAGVAEIPDEFRPSKTGGSPASNPSADETDVADAANVTTEPEGGSVDDQDASAKPASHDQALADNKLSTQAITAAWKAIETPQRADLLPQQRAWIKAKDANCSIEAASASLDPTEQDTARLNCDTAANRSRVDWLKKYLPGAGN
ncbi:lysozyme inhibitor LprI family protein [Novosphingobium lindaniclasticum]